MARKGGQEQAVPTAQQGEQFIDEKSDFDFELKVVNELLHCLKLKTD